MKSTLQDIFEFKTLIIILIPTIAICKKISLIPCSNSLPCGFEFLQNI